ncbi:MAG: choice-of-anchor L domain-containing protein [Bacteroidia bacterium]|nr:choice-of-anchor L domain-containing protein [Bacteroidia bacterium]
MGEGFSAQVLVGNVLVGDGVQTRNIKFTGHDRAMALFENGDDAELGLDKGIILSTGIATNAKGPNDIEDKTTAFNWPGNQILDKIAGVNTKDAAVLEFEFKPQTEEIEFKYIFSSEEYLEWVDEGFNDVFGFFISGPGIVGEQNVAKIPGSNVEVTIDNVNHKRNSQYFEQNDNKGSNKHKYLQHDGQTVQLKANLELEACEWYTIKLAIADVGDPDKDSWVFIGSKSFKHKTGIGSDTSFCSEGFVRTLDAGHPGRDVLWSNGKRTQQIEVSGYGTYWVEVFTQCGSFKDEINILPAIRPISIGNDTMICGNEVDKVLEVKNRVFDRYKWSNGDTTPTLHVDKPGTYSLTVYRDGCTAKDTIQIDDIPIPEFSLGNDTLLCGEVNMNLKPNVSGDDFTWWDGDKNGVKNIKEPGTYWLRVDQGICHYIDTIVVSNRTGLEVDIGPPYRAFCDSKDIRLTTQLNDTSTYSIHWNTGARVGAITVTESGFYSVRVKDKICDYESYDDAEILFLSEALDYYVPNAFSPNMDDLNETISPSFTLSEVESYTFAIYNRWGEKVFETNTLGEAWDGNWKGKKAAPGVYMWYASVKADCLPDNKRYQKGTLTIMR